MTEISIPLKCCSRNEQCVHPEGPWLPATTEYFESYIDGKNGLRAYCRECSRARSRAYRASHLEERRSYDAQYYLTHRTEQAEYKKKYRNAHREEERSRLKKYASEHREELKKYHASYREKHQEELRLKKSEYQKEHRDHIKQYQSDYRTTERGKQVRKANHQLCRARKKEAGGRYTADELDAVLKAHTDKNGLLHCAWCGEIIKDDYHIDHWIPLREGGDNTAGNLRILHPGCNMSKKSRLPSSNGKLI